MILRYNARNCSVPDLNIQYIHIVENLKVKIERRKKFVYSFLLLPLEGCCAFFFFFFNLFSSYHLGFSKPVVVWENESWMVGRWPLLRASGALIQGKSVCTCAFFLLFVSDARGSWVFKVLWSQGGVAETGLIEITLVMVAALEPTAMWGWEYSSEPLCVSVPREGKMTWTWKDIKEKC